jgi:peptidoglycan/LPS O-acetylase OafA/YrhL
MKNINQNERFYLLDIFRGFAAICVVLQHYQHFYYTTSMNLDVSFKYNQLPLFEYISFGYKFGSVAVQFFFLLSGFIFFSFYKKKIAQRFINFKDFLILRISRLYPLHILTLLVMLILQKIYYLFFSSYFVYGNNGIENFLLHFFLVQEWGIANLFNINNSSGFNHPAWSISVEIFAYISFFIISLNFIKNFIESIIFLIITVFIYIMTHGFLGNLAVGILLFYLGGSTYFLSDIIKNNLSSKKNFILFVLILLNILIFGRFLNEFFLNFQNNFDHLIGSRLMILLFFVKFPLIIINLYIIQFFFKNLGKKLILLGDLSYTIYLIHVPLQIIIMFINNIAFDVPFDSNFFFIFYFILIFSTSFFIFKYFELPCKNIIRKKLIKE